VSGATYYEVQWNFQSTWQRVDGTGTSGPAWRHNTNCERTIDVRVRAVNAYGTSAAVSASDFAFVAPPDGQACQ